MDAGKLNGPDLCLSRGAFDPDNPCVLPVLPIVLTSSFQAGAVLPVLLVLGLATRIAAFGMIGLIAMTVVIDIFARSAPPEVIGALSDASPHDPISDLRLLWITVLAVPAVLGGGGLSLDALIRHLWHRGVG
jgi:putative oxidoreductase